MAKGLSRTLILILFTCQAALALGQDAPGADQQAAASGPAAAAPEAPALPAASTGTGASKKADGKKKSAAKKKGKTAAAQPPASAKNADAASVKPSKNKKKQTAAKPKTAADSKSAAASAASSPAANAKTTATAVPETGASAETLPATSTASSGDVSANSGNSPGASEVIAEINAITPPISLGANAAPKANPDAVGISVHDAVVMTLKSNVGIAVQEYNIRISSQKIGEEEAKFDPTVSATLTADETKQQISSALAQPNVSRNDNKTWNFSLSQKLLTGADYTVSFNNNRLKTNSAFAGLNPQFNSGLDLTFTQPLLKNAGIDLNKTEIYVANNNREISDFDFKKKIVDTLAQAESVYWDFVFSIEDLKVKEKSLERARDLERRVKAQVDVGATAPLEIAQARAEVASREQFLISAKDLIRDNEDILKNTMNISLSSPEGQKEFAPVDRPDLIPPPEMSVEEAMKTALENRPDYLSKKKDLENKNIRVKYTENQIYPAIDLIGSLGLNGISGEARGITNFSTGGTSISPFGGPYGTAFDNVISGDYYNWKVGVKLSYPLGNRTAESRLTAARLEVQQALTNMLDLEKSILVDVREALRQIQTDTKRVQSATIARKYAEEKLAAEEKKFSVGLSTSFNVLQYQEDLAAEQSNELKAIIDFTKSKIKLHKTLAKSLDENNIKISPPSP